MVGGDWCLNVHAHPNTTLTKSQKNNSRMALNTEIHLSPFLCRQLLPFYMYRNKRIFLSSAAQCFQQGHTHRQTAHSTHTQSKGERHSYQPQGFLPAFLEYLEQIECGGLTHAGQQMSGSPRLGRLISMTIAPLHPCGGPPLWSGQVEAAGHR